ncbi:MAG TPA: hypothetical protein VIF59_17220 [Methylomirabilota bacterium]|jgi:hypothetical protein
MPAFKVAVLQDANPYTKDLPAANQPSYFNPFLVEQQVDVGNWNFKGVPHHIEKALKIPYTYKDANDVEIIEYLLIGYAGGGAY